jgi:hypothetical protein
MWCRGLAVAYSLFTISQTEKSSMKSFRVKADFDDKRSFGREPIVPSISGRSNGLFCLFLTVLLAMSGCKNNDVVGTTSADFTVNEQFASQLVGLGVPADVAQFFASARMETKTPNDTTCVYLQTFPNGASREMTLRVSPNQAYTPTVDELANTAAGNLPVYNFHFSYSDQPDNTSRIEMTYFVAKEALPKLSALLPNVTSRPGNKASSQMLARIAGSNGAGISWVEIGKQGADVSIGSLLQYAHDSGVKLGPTGSLYALASALSSVSGALQLSKEVNAQLAELDALENCAANPTNPLTRTDPTYSAATVAKVQAARTEIKLNAAVRYLNAMTETASGLNPVTAILSIGLKQAFVYTEQTLKDLSEKTTMREVRLAVVPCDGTWSGTTSVTVSDAAPVYKIKGQVTWVQNAQLSTRTVAVFNPEGTLTIEVLVPGLTITPATHPLTHADGELRINSSTTPPTYTGTSSTQPWSSTWTTIASSSPGLVGVVWFFGDGSTSASGTSISGSKTVGGSTFTYTFTRK